MSALEYLQRYGWHDESCPRYPTYADWYLAEGRVKPCDCGYDKALSELRAAEQGLHLTGGESAVLRAFPTPKQFSASRKLRLPPTRK